MAVMNVKATTKNFREFDAGSAASGGPKEASNLTPEQMKQLGADNVGELLNKVADPNYVDPSKKMRAVGSDKLDKDAFMKLMLAQMKQQDPTNPLKSHEMASHLAQFAQLEQMTNMNTNIEAMRQGQKPTESFQALNFIGKWVSGDSSKVFRAKGDTDHDVRFKLSADAQDVSIKVRDSRGDIIRTVDLKDFKQGDNKWTWNGMKDNGSAASAGEYQIFIQAKGAEGQNLAVKTDFEGPISGVQYTAEGPVLMVGNQTVRMKDVKRIIDPDQAQKNDQKSQNSTQNNLKTSTQPNKIEEKGTEKIGAPEAEPAPGEKLMSDVGLSKEMMARLDKEIKL